MPLPLIDPNPPRLSEMGEALARIEASGIYSNNGPEVRTFEEEVDARLFGGRGASLAVANATLGLMIAIRHAAGARTPRDRFALMPALTFAATAQAAAWAGLTPLVCDVDPGDWSADPDEEERLLRRHGARIAVMVPYATFGNAIDLDRYARLARDHGVGIVVDAAASLGTQREDGAGFGADAPFAVVHSMHATKTFAVAEGGLIHSGDHALIDDLRAMANFGFERGRSATLPGLNAKLPEVLAAMARAKLADLDRIADHRALLEQTYRTTIPAASLQRARGRRRASQFMPVLLPSDLSDRRDAVVARLAADGIGTGCYFSPHLGEQPWFRATATIEPTPVADTLSRRLLSLPITDRMVPADAARVAAAFVDACAAERARPARAAGRPDIVGTIVVGGGPAGTAMLTAAARHGALDALAADGLIVVERGAALGAGRLGRYAIGSDSTARTFLSAIESNPHPALARLVDHPAARAVAAHADRLGVPLVTIGPLLGAIGEALAGIVRAAGGGVLLAHEAVAARRVGDALWSVRLRRLSDGHEFERLARNVVVATGGSQPLDRLCGATVAGARLTDLACGRLIQSDEVLSLGGADTVTDLLSDVRAPRIAVIGGSTSAVTTVALLLKQRLPLGAGAITLLHRRPLRPFFPSVEAARAEGYADFGSDDICPVSGFVYRLAGFRLEARELVLRMLAVDGRAPDPRVALHRIDGDDPVARSVVREADLVVAALGYRPLALPIAEADGTAIALAADAGRPMIDGRCRVLDAGGRALPGLYGIGLAAGFVPSGPLGGEPSFSGQANGLWLWQNDVGQMIVEQLLGRREAMAA